MRKFPLRRTLAQAMVPDNIGTVPSVTTNKMRGFAEQRAGEHEMPEKKAATEVAGRVCAITLNVGDTVAEGDEIAFVEAMKMEIPVTAPASGKLAAILVKLDDVVAEGQAVAIIET